MKKSKRTQEATNQEEANLQKKRRGPLKAKLVQEGHIIIMNIKNTLSMPLLCVWGLLVLNCEPFQNNQTI